MAAAYREQMSDQGGPVGATEQELRFCRGFGGARLAWARHGAGPPVVIASCWLSHLQYDWQSPVWRHFLADLGRVATVIRYDERGFGLSDWSIDDFSYAARLADLEVIADTIEQDRFALMGMSGGAPIAIGYAAKHPERVSRLILYGAACKGVRQPLGPDADEEAYLALIRAGWARTDSVFRRVFTSIFIPDATEEQMGWLDELQRMSTSTENAVASRISRRQTDVSELLEAIAVPTLVLHARDDRVSPFAGGREISARIPDARLVPLESRNHILLADEPAWADFLGEVTAFLEPDRRASENRSVETPLPLSAREAEIVSLAARGRDNGEIAAALQLSVRTVERHLQNVYLKAGVSGRTARTAVVGRFLSRS
jgi:pimeloyl-ACP methyl ester carboxylesterase/DNA-binding CsgD family transcriptional regulator